ITGPPGAGKSTLVNALSMAIKEMGNTVGIIAVDPTSPFTGGALLGDRIRMGCALSDPDIYMRSMASRGGTGGLAKTTYQAADVLDAFGFDFVIIETVGVGQLELEVTSTVDSTVVVLVPETSGNVQAMKAGLIEIADIFVINKADRQGADILKQELQDSLNLLPKEENNWKIPLLKTIAVKGKGVKELAEKIMEHKKFQEANDLLSSRRLNHKKRKIVSIIRHKLERKLWNNSELIPILDNLALKCTNGEIDPYLAAEKFIEKAEFKI
ncbi:MAG: methylmalonyl Co-A mutase-associated GTPase MeaB, partial [Vulcanimicrobiota bacterium]